MRVICKACKKKNEREDSYKVIVNGKNHYYCNEKEYLDEVAEKKARLEVFDMCMDIIGATTNTALFTDITEISKIHPYTKILGYLTDNFSNIQGFMSKSFSSEYGKIKYFTTIIKNNIGDYVPEIKEERIINMDYVDSTEVNYKVKPKRKGLSQYTDEYEGC